jgi:hypothetical protein
MKLTIALAIGLGLAAGSASAAQPRADGYQQELAARPQLSRHAAVKQLVLKWGPSASRQQGVGLYRWADNMVPLFGSADLGNLNKALSATSYTDMVMTITGSKKIQAGKLPGGVVPMNLGSLTSDLVYTPLPSCLILDTRVVGGAFVAGALRNYKASGANFTAQGGSNTNCGIPAGVRALVVTVQNINATARGYFRMWPYGTTKPLASVMSYGPTQNTQNNVVLATTVGDAADFSVQSSANSHLVVAVLGYFAAPVATQLDCTQEVGDAVSVANGATGTAGVACPAGYALTGGGGLGFAGMPIHSSFSFGGWVIQAKNTSGATKDLTAVAICCRVPGR